MDKLDEAFNVPFPDQFQWAKNRMAVYLLFEFVLRDFMIDKHTDYFVPVWEYPDRFGQYLTVYNFCEYATKACLAFTLLIVYIIALHTRKLELVGTLLRQLERQCDGFNTTLGEHAAIALAG